MFNPHAYSRPAEEIATLKPIPVDTENQLAPAGPDTNTGDETLTNELVPKAPVVLSPHAHTVLSVRIATVWEPARPNDTDFQSIPGYAVIETGDDTPTVLLIPSWPDVLVPQA